MQVDTTQQQQQQQQSRHAASCDDSISDESMCSGTTKKRDACSPSHKRKSHEAKRARVAEGQGNLPAVSTPQRKTTIAITPVAPTSKNQAANNNDGTTSPQDKSKRSSLTSLLLNAIDLPPQVPNVFASKQPYTPCQCLGHQCSRGCLSADFLDVYGWEYKALLKEAEHREYKSADFQDSDPLSLLTVSKIVPSPEHRTREQTEWASPRSINWDLDDYMERQPDLAPKMRSILIDWLVELTDEYKLCPTTFHLAITLIDKSLACAKDEDDENGFFVRRDLLQCLGW